MRRACKRCKKSKPIESFPIDRAKVDGTQKRRLTCRACFNTLRAKKEQTGRRLILAKKLREAPTQKIRTSIPRTKRYVVTYAQNATPVHKSFFGALKKYAEHNDAELIVIPGRYTNPTSLWTRNMEHDEWWAPEVAQYLFEGKLKLGRSLTIFGDISIQPTADRPLTGFDVHAGETSAIFGHPKLQLRTVATAKRRYPRIFTTTGACTKPNYTRTKAGKKGEAHHVYGATIVEQGERLFHVRQVTAAKDGSFIDLDTHYTAEKVSPAPRALALVCGDIHVDKKDDTVLAATFEGPESIVGVLRPEKILYHDVLDFDVRNHHSIGNFKNRYDRATGKKPDLVEGEVQRAIEFIDATPVDAEPIVVRSNHDEAFDRWLATADPRVDPINAPFFHSTWSKIFAHRNATSTWPNALELVYTTQGRSRARFVGRSDVLKIGPWACNFHGDHGLNGARAVPDTYARLGIKTVTAHHHSPSITDGNVTVGVKGSLDMGYNGIPSSWLNTDYVIYADGQGSLISIIDGEWRA